MFAKAFGRFGALLDTWWPPLVTVLGTLVLTLQQRSDWQDALKDFPSWYGKNSEWIWIVALAATVVALAPIVQTIRLTRFERGLEDNWATYDVLMDSIIMPLEDRLHALVAMGRRNSQLKVATTSLVATAVGMIAQHLRDAGGEKNVRVNYYLLLQDDAEDFYLQVAEQSQSVRRQKITREDPEGRLIVDRILSGQSKYCEDLRSRDEAGERPDPSVNHSYRCFLSVPLVHDDRVFGMLSANTPAPGGVPRGAEMFMRTVGGLIALAQALGGLAKGYKISGEDLSSRTQTPDTSEGGEE